MGRSRGGMVRKRKVRKVIPLAVMANWCAHKGYPRLKEEEEEKVEERKTTFWDEPEQALVECMSADEPDVALVRQLLSKPKVSLDAKDDTFGLTPTHFAARLGNQQIGALLLDRNPEQVPDKMGNTPLHYAAKSGFNEMVKMLLPRRAAIDGKNKNGK
ncbi:Inversin [Symbiodinium microadriaticum]|uniref:Inversin n=1 Tax=Symbiodinium microadriaticum TaxID=2951 RepID=A0A1Q9C1B5_SYMMI|nr:Inversin [Symbiodinium microadriaticum]